MRASALLSSLLVLIYAVACKTITKSNQAAINQNSSGFVKIENGKFILDSKPFFFMGSNFYRLALSDAFGRAVAKFPVNGSNQYPQIEKVMENYAQENIRVVRMWGFSCEKSRGTNLIPPIIYTNFKYSDEALEQLDFTVAAAGRHGIKVILTMVNFEPEYCGMEWWVENSFSNSNDEDKKRLLYSCFNKDPRDHSVNLVVKDPIICEQRGMVAMPSRELFYTDPLVKENFKKHLANILTRKNSYTGKAYRDEPAIMAIEVANEPHTSDYFECMAADIGNKTNNDCRSEDMKKYNAGKTVNSWLKEISAYVKSIDSNHLVSSGEEGYRSGHDDANCMQPHEWIHNGSKGVNFAENVTIPTIDFMTTHLYPDNWAIPPADLPWFDRCIIKDRANLAKKNGKPIIIEETGFDENLTPSKPQDYAKNRGQYLAKIMSYGTAAGFQGLLVWQAAPLTSNDQVAEDDSFTFPIKTKDAAGKYNYSNEGLVIRKQADCMLDYSIRDALSGECFSSGGLPSLPSPSNATKFPICAPGVPLEKGWGWISDASACNLDPYGKSQFEQKGGCSCKAG